MNIELDLFKLKETLKALSKLKCNLFLTGIVTKTVRNTITFSKSNSDTTMNISLDCISYGGDERFVLPSGIVELIKKIKEDNLTLMDNQIKAGNKIIKFSATGPSQPEDLFRGDLLFTTTEKELHRMLEVKYAMAQDDTRPTLCGLFFNNNETCAIDGYRVSVRKGNYESSAKFVLNKNTVEILDSTLDYKSDNEVHVYTDDKQENVKFEIGNIEIVGKILQGEFIKYKNIIPEEHFYVSIIDMGKLKNELEFINGVKTKHIQLNFTENKLTLLTSQCKEEFDKQTSEIKTKELQVQAHNDYKEKYNIWATKKAKAEKNKKEFKLKCPEEKNIKVQKVYSLVPVADIKIEVDCDTKFDDSSKSEFRIAVNSKYLSECLKTYTDKVEFRMSACVNPIVITQDGDNLEMVLPIRIRS
ncbi:MAG: hypothetical protein ACREV6_22095 [Clostridium sp.]|uniref:DNA polymerase III subunit beta family protein n=1 Tax=Clostridium sp. TaxID=1506 RepID=UPI003D6D715F